MSYIAQNQIQVSSAYGPIQPSSANGQLLYGMIMSGSGHILNMTFNTQDPTGSETTTVTVYKNGAASLCTATVTGGSLSAADTTHSIAFSAGDEIHYKVTKSTSSASVSVSVTAEIDI